MNNIKKDPIDQLIDGLFNTSLNDIISTDFSGQKPAANMLENKEAYEIHLAAPGLVKSDFKVEVIDNHLSISVDKLSETDNNEKPFLRKEFDYAQFTRRFKLSDKIDRSNISATYNNGILKISMAKKEKDEQGPQTINID